jgi:hypothetical protein
MAIGNSGIVFRRIALVGISLPMNRADSRSIHGVTVRGQEETSMQQLSQLMPLRTPIGMQFQTRA